MSDDKLLLYVPYGTLRERGACRRQRLRQRIYAQNGLTYCENPYDIERFQKLRAIAAEIMTTYSNVVWTMDYGLWTNNYV